LLRVRDARLVWQDYIRPHYDVMSVCSFATFEQRGEESVSE